MLLNDKNWDKFDNDEDPNELWELMVINIKKSIDEIFPLKTFKINKLKEPWISNELIGKIKKQKNRNIMMIG